MTLLLSGPVIVEAKWLNPDDQSMIWPPTLQVHVLPQYQDKTSITIPELASLCPITYQNVITKHSRLPGLFQPIGSFKFDPFTPCQERWILVLLTRLGRSVANNGAIHSWGGGNNVICTFWGGEKSAKQFHVTPNYKCSIISHCFT